MKKNKQAATGSDEKDNRHVVCLLDVLDFSYLLYSGVMKQKRRWDLDIYLKYIQKEVNCVIVLCWFLQQSVFNQPC